MKTFCLRTTTVHLPPGRVTRRVRRRAACSPALALLVWLLLPGYAAQAQRPQVRLDLLPSSRADADPTYVYFEQGATAGFDTSFDASKLANPSGLNLASLEVGGQQLTINGLPPALLGAPLTVSLFLGVPQYGTYVLEVAQLDNFAGADVALVDNLLNTSTALALGVTYSFDLTAANTAGTYATDTRFTLQFTPGTGPGPLPVTLISFTAEVQPQGVRLGWATASERQSHYFAVERSPDGQQFAEIGRVAAAGTSSQPHRYGLLDAQPLAGVAYYRLRQVDLDASAHYSAVRVVAGRGAASGLQVFPVPARTAATLLGAAPGTLVQAVDARGRLVATATADAAGTAVLGLPAGLASGLYVVRAAGQVTRLLVE